MGRPKPSLKTVGKGVLTPRGLLVVCVLVSTVLGFTSFNRFGESWDEESSFQYGEDAIRNYSAPAGYWEWYGILKDYGPAYFMLGGSIASYIVKLFPAWGIADAWHLVNHLSFQIATVGIFCLCLRFAGGWSALAATVLFATQPLLFGHSFINPKDVPFMAGFVLALVLGFRLGDRATAKRAELGVLLRDEWERTPTRRRRLLVGTGVGAALVCLELLVATRAVLPAITRIVADAYAGDSLPLVNEWFARLAREASRLPVEAYQHKATALYMRFRWPIVALAATPFVGLATSTFRSSLAAWWRFEGDLLLMGLIGGIVAGLATATRVIGLLVVVLVGLVVILRRGLLRIPALAAYTGVACATCYAAWPYLQGAPLARIWESLRVMSRFPWSGGILFGGELLKPEALPWNYVPLLLVIQLTLPAVLLAGVGIPLTVRRALSSGNRLPEYLALGAWFGGPLVAVLFLGSTLYGNFRQLLFIMPPLFVFASVALEAIAFRLRSRVAAAVIGVFALLPGIIGIARLHPYEYVYYNALVGGVHGASRSYELDYWCVSYRQAMEWINEAAPRGALIAVAPPVHVAQQYARTDLRLVTAQVPGDLGPEPPVFGLGCGRGNNDLGFFPQYAAVHEVAIEGARLAVIRDFRVPAGEGED